jgi:hypothetical protein
MKLLVALLVLLFCATSLAAQDLNKIDRTIAKEPAYQTKNVKYCLLVFGPEAKHRVWLVQDGDTLYVDRNGNGDLTEAGKKVTAKKGDFTNAVEGVYEFEVGDIPEGKLLHKGLRVQIAKLETWADREEVIKRQLAKEPQAKACLVYLEVEMPGWKSFGLEGRVMQTSCPWDHRGVSAWSDRPETAPIVHFRGPWHLLHFGTPPRLTAGRAEDFVLALGTPGFGPGTTAYVAYEGVVPEKVYPKVEITFPPRPGEPPRKELYELKERC